ncbi:restriction endonuclease subunit S [Gallibacterium anatis]|uniref:restriction endonuclease subunit S n=1 Tax=Gallibacterium anatis TaxID=750 RepID=UPI001B336F98|nr:restriction endonuclease subunit S [Gallibacterium anatis]MBP4132855.1 restriction endonuclease subunit S [Gallibacterium anatis]
MNYLEKLLQGAPVEWKTLGEVAKLQRGRVISKQYLSENIGDYPVYSSQTANNGEIGTISTFDFDQEAITWTTDGANAGTVFHRFGKFSITNVCGLVNILDLQKLDYKFLFYWLSIEAKKYVYSGMGNPKLMSNQMEKIKIPIPPLAVQKEIAQILDRFTALTSELTSELTLRQKQYQHYRDKLLTFGDEVEWKTLGEVAPPIRGKRVVRAELNENGIYPVYQNSLKPLGFYDKTNCRKYSTFIIAAGAAGEVGFSDVDFWAADDCYYFKCPEILNDKFLYYFLLKENHKLFSQVRRASIPRLGKTAIESLKIPLPPLEEQKRIATILDKFHTLTSSLSDGLPKEIELRQKQYEYYRDLLLNFKQDEASLSPS